MPSGHSHRDFPDELDRMISSVMVGEHVMTRSTNRIDVVGSMFLVTAISQVRDRRVCRIVTDDCALGSIACSAFHNFISRVGVA